MAHIALPVELAAVAGTGKCCSGLLDGAAQMGTNGAEGIIAGVIVPQPGSGGGNVGERINGKFVGRPGGYGFGLGPD